MTSLLHAIYRQLYHSFATPLPLLCHSLNLMSNDNDNIDHEIEKFRDKTDKRVKEFVQISSEREAANRVLLLKDRFALLEGESYIRKKDR